MARLLRRSTLKVEGAYFLNFNNTWIPVGADALEARFCKSRAGELPPIRLSNTS
jgi:hypothetical protein